MIKGSIQGEDMKIVNIYAPNIEAPQYIRQMLTAIKGENDSNTIIIGDFNTPVTPMDRSAKQKINKETQALSDTLDQMDLIDIYRTFYWKTTEYTFFSSAQGTFSRIDHISSLGKFKKLKSYQASFLTTILWDYMSIIGKNCKKYKHMEAKQYTTKQPRDHWRSQKGNKKIPRNKWQWKHDDPKPMGCSKSSSKGEFIGIKSYLKKQQK